MTSEFRQYELLNTFILDSTFQRTTCRITPNFYCLCLRHVLGRFSKNCGFNAGLLRLEQRVLVRLDFVGGWVCIYVVLGLSCCYVLEFLFRTVNREQFRINLIDIFTYFV